MLTTLPYCNFKSYRANTCTKLYLNLIYQHDDCFKSIYLKAANSQYVFKKYTPMLLQLYMLLTSNELLLIKTNNLKTSKGELCTLYFY